MVKTNCHDAYVLWMDWYKAYVAGKPESYQLRKIYDDHVKGCDVCTKPISPSS